LTFGDTFEACGRRDVYCGLLHCEGGTYNKQLTSFSKLNSVQVTGSEENRYTCLSITGTSINSMLDDESITVAEGTPCGSFQVMYSLGVL